jgi:hypothetical protein
VPAVVKRNENSTALPVQPMPVLRPVGSHTTDASVSAAETLTPPAGASFVRLETTTQAVRYTLDGTTPTASVGFLIAVGVPTDIYVGSGSTLKVIQAAASASIQYQWFR